MNVKGDIVKKKKIIKLLDPEPKRCYPKSCGYEKIEKTNTVIDVVSMPTFVPAPRNDPQEYLHHDVGCLWAQWAMREIARNM